MKSVAVALSQSILPMNLKRRDTAWFIVHFRINVWWWDMERTSFHSVYIMLMWIHLVIYFIWHILEDESCKQYLLCIFFSFGEAFFCVYDYKPRDYSEMVEFMPSHESCALNETHQPILSFRRHGTQNAYVPAIRDSKKRKGGNHAVTRNKKIHTHQLIQMYTIKHNTFREYHT